MKKILNTDSLGKFALQGYDPVTFHTMGKAVKADPYIAAEYSGYKFLFASEENKSIFLKTPAIAHSVCLLVSIFLSKSILGKLLMVNLSSITARISRKNSMKTSRGI